MHHVIAKIRIEVSRWLFIGAVALLGLCFVLLISIWMKAAAKDLLAECRTRESRSLAVYRVATVCLAGNASAGLRMFHGAYFAGRQTKPEISLAFRRLRCCVVCSRLVPFLVGGLDCDVFCLDRCPQQPPRSAVAGF